MNPKQRHQDVGGGCIKEVERDRERACPLLLIHRHNILSYLFVSPVHVERRLDYLSLCLQRNSHSSFLSLSSSSCLSALPVSSHSESEDNTTCDQVKKKERKKGGSIDILFVICSDLDVWGVWRDVGTVEGGRKGGDSSFMSLLLQKAATWVRQREVEKHENHLRQCAWIHLKSA